MTIYQIEARELAQQAYEDYLIDMEEEARTYCTPTCLPDCDTDVDPDPSDEIPF